MKRFSKKLLSSAMVSVSMLSTPAMAAVCQPAAVYAASNDSVAALTSQYNLAVAQKSSAKTAFDQAEAALAQAQAAKNTAAGLKEQAQKNYDAGLDTVKQISDAQNSLSTLKSEKAALEAQREELGPQYLNAMNSLDAAEAELESAKSHLNQAEAAWEQIAPDTEMLTLDDARAQIEKGSAGFFEYLKNEYNDQDAAYALDLILDTTGQYQDGAKKSINQSGWTDFKNENTASSLEMMKKAVDSLNQLNEVRAIENETEGKHLGVVKVSSTLMAMAQKNVDASSRSLDHSQSYNVAENLAWGYVDPFSGWYEDEKEIYMDLMDQYMADGMSKSQASMKIQSHDLYLVGHYLNVISNASIFGSASSIERGFCDGQVFAYSYKGFTGMSVEQYQNLFYEYYNKVMDDYALAQSQAQSVNAAELESAKAELESAEAELEQAQSNYDQAHQSWTEIQKQIDAADQAIDSKRTAISKKQSQLDQLKKNTPDLDALKKELDTRTAALKDAQQKLDQASKNRDEKKTAYDQAAAKAQDLEKQLNAAKAAQNQTKQEVKTVTMYRLYNPNSGEHFYTSSAAELNNLIRAGWKNEGKGWTAPAKSNTPVYRMYNPNAGDHHYTTSAAERDSLKKAGWKYEGIGWYSDDAKGVALYRQYNPNAKAGSHNYTASASEKKMLIKAGWKDEGIAWYGVN